MDRRLATCLMLGLVVSCAAPGVAEEERSESPTESGEVEHVDRHCQESARDDDASPVRGCIAGRKECPQGTTCCIGEPYPSDGACLAECALISDRALKENVSPVDTARVLEALASVPIHQWRYRGDEREVHHVGPMAQDFHRAFGLGDSDRHIHAVDATGVAMAAIQALYERMEGLGREQRQLRRENEALRRELASLRGESGAGGPSEE